MAEDDDPVIVSYDVYLTKPNTIASNETSNPTGNSSKLFVLQYPSHRPASKPYDASRSQKPISLRTKTATGLVELDVPLMMHEHYNQEAGERYGKAIGESRTLQAGGTHGLAGGFSTVPAQLASLRDVPQHERFASQPMPLSVQTLAGKLTKPNERDPLYLLGSFHGNSLHLSHLDAVVQMRPQLHHIDAEEELNQKRFQTNSNSSALKGVESTKLESKAVEIKLRDTKDDAKDRNLNENARLLREVQADHWRHHTWSDQLDTASHIKHDEQFCLHNCGRNTNEERNAAMARLRSAVSNGDWLDKMSAPREDGKKGLLAKLRGRERERARRKKAEEEKRTKTKDSSTTVPSGTGPLLDMSSDTDESSASEPEAAPPAIVSVSAGSEVEMIDGDPADSIEIKEEPSSSALPTTSAPPAASRKRGRPRKSRPDDAIEINN